MVYHSTVWRVRFCKARPVKDGNRFLHGFCIPGGYLCADPLILSLTMPYRYGAIVQHVGSLLAGPDCTASDADRFAEDFFGVRVHYWCSTFGPLPIVNYTDLQRVACYVSMSTEYDPHTI